MTTIQSVTPAQALDALREKVARGLHTRNAQYVGRMEMFHFETTVPDQSVAFPGRRVKLYASLYVISTDSGQLVLKLTAHWYSIFGSHTTNAAYVVTQDGSEVAVAARWEQLLPTPTLANLDVHTGGVGVDAYHRHVVGLLHDGGRPVSNMLSDDPDRIVDPRELVALAAVISSSVPQL